MKARPENYRLYEYGIFTALLLIAMLFCVCAGSVGIPVKDTVKVIINSIFKLPIPEGISQSIIVSVRLPRVLCAALIGACLSLGGGAMQGLLRNPLADGSTLGVASGASLGATISIAFGISIPGIPFGGTMIMAMMFAFLSLIISLSLAYRLDFSLSTNTIILIGVIFTMFTNSIISFIVTFAGQKVKSIMFWTMGSLSGSSYVNALTLIVALAGFGTAIIFCSRELNAFAIGEANARHVGVNVKRVKLLVLISVSALIGVCVSIGGTIGFVGLVIPHMTRMLTGPNHKRLLPASMFFGAIFLMLTDLIGRVIINPLQLPIGVVTSFIGSIVFIYIFFSTRKVN